MPETLFSFTSYQYCKLSHASKLLVYLYHVCTVTLPANSLDLAGPGMTNIYPDLGRTMMVKKK